MKKRILSVLITLVMLIGLVTVMSISASAEETEVVSWAFGTAETAPDDAAYTNSGTLAQAFTAANDNENTTNTVTYVKLTDDVKIESNAKFITLFVLKADKSMVIDLNHHTLTISFTNTVVDGSGNCFAIDGSSGSTLTIKNGKYFVSAASPNSPVYAISSSGTVNVEGCTIEVNGKSSVRGVDMSGGAIIDSTITATSANGSAVGVRMYDDSSPSLTVSNCTINAIGNKDNNDFGVIRSSNNGSIQLTVNGPVEITSTGKAFGQLANVTNAVKVTAGDSAGSASVVPGLDDEDNYAKHYVNIVPLYTIKWNVDGVETTETYEYGVTPSFKGSTLKAEDEQYTYTFADWDSTVSPATSDVTYTAIYNKTVKKYTVTWLDYDDSVIDTTTVEYGTVPTHTDPTRAETAEYSYTFAGWDSQVVAVTGDATYKATYTATKNTYTITWLDYDNNVIDTTTVEYGTVPTHTDPTRAETAEYSYTFAGWEPQVDAVTGDATYKATYTATKNTYTITWLDHDNNVIDTTTVEYGDTPTHADPTRDGNAQYSYIFKGWAPSVYAVTGDATYVATYDEILNKYTVDIDVNLPEGGTVVGGTYDYGSTVTLTATTNPGYIFMGWFVDGNKIDPEITITEDITVYAKFADYESDKVAINAAIDNIDTAIQNINTTTGDLAGRIGELSQAINQAQGTLSALEATHATDKAALEKAIADAQSTLEQTIEQVKADLADAVKDITANAENIEKLSAAITDAQKTLNALGTTHATDKAALEKAIADAQAALEKSISQVKADLEKAVDNLDKTDTALSDRIDTLNTAMTNAQNAIDLLEKNSATKADVEALEASLKAADTALSVAVEQIKADLEDAMSALESAINAGDTALDGKITELNDALAAARLVLEATDADNKAELTDKIDEAYATLDVAINAVQANLDDVKEELNGLQTFVIVVCVISCISLCGCGAFVIWFFIDRKKKI